MSKKFMLRDGTSVEVKMGAPLTYKVMIVMLDGSSHAALTTKVKGDARKALEDFREHQYEAWLETE